MDASLIVEAAAAGSGVGGNGGSQRGHESGQTQERHGRRMRGRSRVCRYSSGSEMVDNGFQHQIMLRIMLEQWH
jgi:hypothetical protein